MVPIFPTLNSIQFVELEKNVSEIARHQPGLPTNGKELPVGEGKSSPVKPSSVRVPYVRAL